jgi:hypothetical protein
MLVGLRFVLVLLALLAFVLAAFHVPAPVDLTDAGLALYMAAILAWWGAPAAHV